MKKKKLRPWAVVTAVFLMAVLAAVIILAPLFSEFMRTESKDGDPVTVTIEQGTTLSGIADVLKENGVIKYKSVFVARVKLDKKTEALNYGTFELNTGMSITEIIDILENNKFVRETVTITVPEGYSVEQIASRVSESGLCSEKEFLDALNDDYDYSFVGEIPDKDGVKYKLQGFLFPKTYEFYTDASAHDVIDTMLAQFEKELSAVDTGDTPLYEAITLASLVEREAKLDSERATIAGVMYNRIEIGMKLQIDATVAYAVTDGKYDITRVTRENLKIDSPYNTYVVDGLPAGPIANPGLSSIKAAYNPENHEYLFYHTDTEKNDGSHIFTKTYEEHLNTMN